MKSDTNLPETASKAMDGDSDSVLHVLWDWLIDRGSQLQRQNYEIINYAMDL